MPKKLGLVHLALACTVIYGAIAGFRTLSDFDLWWQLASGRHLVTTGHLARVDVFSYTVPGTAWIYPAGAGLIFYLLLRLGGYALLSLLAPAAATAVVLLLLRRSGVLRAWMVALAVPAIAWRTSVRADLFTTVFTAAYLALLWDHVSAPEGTRKTRLWILPVLMLAWVNLHPGFVLGLGLLLFFLACSPKTLAPWAALSAAATLANPWGWRVYQAVVEQSKALRYQQGFIGEWARVPLSWQSLSDAFRVRDPGSAYWMLLMVAAVAIGAALFQRGEWRRRVFGGLLLAAAAFASLRYFRFQALFAITAAVVGPDLLASLRPRWRWSAAVATAALALLVGVRVTDLAGNRYYVTHGELATFGVGVSWWFPERALHFMEQRKLPRELYHDYNLGGYLTWRGRPNYPVFIDGRALPFGPGLFFLQQRLARLGPESEEWRQALERFGIRTLLVSTARFGGYGALPLKAFCQSNLFRLVYLDETAAVFVRGAPSDLPVLDCGSARLAAPPAGAPAAARFNFFANAGKLYYALERDAEAEQAWEQARRIFDDDPSLHLDLGQLRQAQGRLPEAEAEFRRAIALGPTPTEWYALGDLLASQQRYAEAAQCFRQSVARSFGPSESYRALGQSYLALGQPRRALEAFDNALRSSRYQGPADSLGQGFTARTLLGRAAALLILRDAPAAVAALERAVTLAPSDPRLRLALAEALLAAGRLPEAARAVAQARQLGASGPAVDQLEARTRRAPPQ